MLLFRKIPSGEYVLAAAILFLLLTAPVAAHPPVSVTPVYDQNTSLLGVTIVHPVQGNSRHYITAVSISVNGRVVNKTEYTSQPSDTFTYTYPLELRPGNSVAVMASCSQFGERSATFIMPGETQAVSPAGTVPVQVLTQQSPVSLFTLAAGAAVAVIMRPRI